MNWTRMYGSGSPGGDGAQWALASLSKRQPVVHISASLTSTIRASIGSVQSDLNRSDPSADSIAMSSLLEIRSRRSPIGLVPSAVGGEHRLAVLPVQSLFQFRHFGAKPTALGGGRLELRDLLRDQFWLANVRHGRPTNMLTAKPTVAVVVKHRHSVTH